MKTTRNIIQPLRNHLKPLALAVTAGVLLMSHTPAVANITLTDTGTQWAGGAINNATISNNFTVNASANVLVVSIGTRSQGSPLNAGTVPVVKYNGVTLIRAAEALGQNANYLSAMTYYMFEPPTGAALPLEVSFPGTNVLTYAVDAYTLGGVDVSRQPELFPGWTASAVPPVNNLLTSSVTLNNLISGSWVADTAAFRNPGTGVFTAAVTSGTFGALNTSGPVTGALTDTTGHLWAHRSSDSIFGGALVENVTSPTVTVQHTVGAAGFAFNVAGVAFAPLAGTGYTISGTISVYDAGTGGVPDGALVELKVGGVVHAQKTVPSGGAYSFTVPVGTYTIRASKSPYLPIESSAIVVTDTNVTQDLTLPQDTIPPVWASGWPKTTDVGSTGFSARVKTDEIGTAYYVVVANNDPAPDSAQVAAGTDSSNNPALKSGSISITAANTEFSAAVTGLAQNSFFDVYFVAKDPSGNLQGSPVKLDIGTLLNLYTENFIGNTATGIAIYNAGIGWNADGGGYAVLDGDSRSVPWGSVTTPDGDYYYSARGPGDSGPTIVYSNAGDDNGLVNGKLPILDAARIGTTFMVDWASSTTKGAYFTAEVGGKWYVSDLFGTGTTNHGTMSGRTVTQWVSNQTISAETGTWYEWEYGNRFGVSTIPLVGLPAGNITRVGLWWATTLNGDSYAIDNFRIDATPASSTYVWDGGTGNWADANWSFGGSPGQPPATGYDMFIDTVGGNNVTVNANFSSALSANVGLTNAATLTVNSSVTLGVIQEVNVGSSISLSSSLQVDGKLTSPSVVSSGTVAISNTGIVNASSLFQINGGSLTSSSTGALNIGTGGLMLAGGTGATLDGPLSITGGTITLTSGTLTYNNASPASPAVLVFKGGTLAGTGSVVPTSRYEVYNATVNNSLSGATASLLAGSGIVTLTGSNNYGGNTTIQSYPARTTLRVADVADLNSTGGYLYFDGRALYQFGPNGRPATLESKGTLTRTIGTGAQGISFTGPTGDGNPALCFAAVGGPLNIDLNGGVGATIAWDGATGLNNSYLILGSTNADNVVTIKNGLNMSTADREIEVVDNPGSPNDSVVIQGGIRNDATARKLTKSGNGTLTLKGVNTYTGSTTVSSGTLILDVGAQLKFVIPASSGGARIISGAGTVVLNGDFYIDTATNTDGAAITTGTWQLENVPSLTTAYGTSFRVVNSAGNPWNDAGSDKWTKIVGSKLYTFDETNGTLALSEAPTTGYAVWANANGVSLIPSEDSNNDGVANGVAYFMNKTGLATNPAINGTTKQVTWPNGGKIASSQYGIEFVVQTSSDLQTWTDVLDTDLNLINTDYSAGPPAVDGELSYTLTGASPRFVRLKVTPN